MPNKLWKPKSNDEVGCEEYWVVTEIGTVDRFTWYGESEDAAYYRFGNVFRTKKLALAARDKVKKLLLTLKHG